jgi:hypothetical protein
MQPKLHKKGLMISIKYLENWVLYVSFFSIWTTVRIHEEWYIGKIQWIFSSAWLCCCTRLSKVLLAVHYTVYPDIAIYSPLYSLSFSSRTLSHTYNQQFKYSTSVPINTVVITPSVIQKTKTVDQAMLWNIPGIDYVALNSYGVE